MRIIPLTIGTFHFVGIGGIGMSGIAEVLHNLGYKVQGSDIADNANVKRLRELGIKVMIGHAPENLGDASVCVISSAVKNTNVEVAAARAKLIPVVRRAEMLAEIMRLKWSVAVAGTHGKTTTTSLVAKMLEAAGLDPTVINGGIINAYGTNTRLGQGEWMVVEADESDGTFVKLPATMGIVTNIDPEHLDHFGTFDAVQKSFENFIHNIPFYGCAALCIDHPIVRALIPKVADRKILTYGFSPQADIRAENVKLSTQGATYDVVVGARAKGGARRLNGLSLPMYGQHNVQNALAAFTIANEMGIPDKILQEGLSDFSGVKRRFTKTGSVNGITVIDDYGHHPVEIAAVLKAARQATKNKVIAVVQPHRYSRVNNLFEDFCGCFHDADTVVVTPIYSAGEEPIHGITRDALAEGIRRRGHRDVQMIDGKANLAPLLNGIAKPGDYIICLGAGDITYWAQSLPEELSTLQKVRVVS
ncbi:MAG: UDP-N-acetylmuramate--L-alanine ligase [Dongiaceae bacterium]